MPFEGLDKNSFRPDFLESKDPTQSEECPIFKYSYAGNTFVVSFDLLKKTYEIAREYSELDTDQSERESLKVYIDKIAPEKLCELRDSYSRKHFDDTI